MLDPAKVAAAATTAAAAESDDDVKHVNFLSPEELARQVSMDRAFQTNRPEDIYIQEVAQEARYQKKVMEHNAMVEDHNRRVRARKAKIQLKVDQARAEKKKRKKMKKKGR